MSSLPFQPDYPKAIVTPLPATSFDDRPAGTVVNMVVLHATAGPGDFNPQELTSTINWFSNPKNQVSSHYLIDRDGTVYQLVQESRRAWHAGYQGAPINYNTASIGIEVVHSSGETAYPEALLKAEVLLLRDIIKRRDIKRENIVPHYAINSGKTDPKGQDLKTLLDSAYSLVKPPTVSLPENARNEAYRALQVPYNPIALFPKYAREHGYGAPLTLEFDFTMDGVQYRGQGFVGKVVYAKVGEWDKPMETEW